MGILSNLAGKAITRGAKSGLKGSGRTARLRTLNEIPISESTQKRWKEGRTLFGTDPKDIQQAPTPAEITPLTTDMPPTITTTPPPVDEAKTARMIMLQGADEPIEAAPPITPIETPPIRAEGERIMESAGAAKLYPTYDKYLSDIKELGFSLKDLKSTNLPTNEKQFLIDRERAIQEYVEAPAQGTVRRILSEGGEPYSSNAFGPQAKGVWYKNLKGVDTFEELDTPPVRAEVDALPEVRPAPNRITPDNLPEDAVEAFVELGNTQRGRPESAMLDATGAYGGGVLPTVVEHTGDLSHRMSHMAKYGYFLPENVKEKTKRILRTLDSPYGFEKEMGENFRNNAKFRGTTEEALRAKVFGHMDTYAVEHAKLPVYNRPQWLAREAAVAVGKRDWGTVRRYVEELDKLVDDIDAFDRAAGAFTRGPDGKLQQYVTPDPIRTEMDELVPSQAITSEKTSRKQVSAIFKNKLFDEPSGSRNLDIGGGKYNLGSDWLKENKGISNFVFDPYNRSKKHNAAVLKEFETELADSVTVANVLNVIKEKLSRAKVIEDSFKYLKDGKKAYFQIYEGAGKEAGSGIGRETTDGWQNYKKTIEYIEEIEKVFGKGNVERKGNTLITKKPSARVDQNLKNIASSKLHANAERNKKTGVGKRMGSQIFIEKSYADKVSKSIPPIMTKLKTKYPNFEFKVIRYNTKTGEIRFIEAPDFDTSPEPIVGKGITYNPVTKEFKESNLGSSTVYHHKWLFVDDNYTGFDVSEAMNRTIEWTTALNKYNQQNPADITTRNEIGSSRLWKEIQEKIGIKKSEMDEYAKGGVVDMRNGGRVGAAVVAASLMASGGQASASTFSPSKEFVEYIKSVENAGRKGYNKDTKLWYAYTPTGDVGEGMEEISYGIVRPKGGSPLTQEAAEKLLGERMQNAFKVAERVVDKRMKPGTFKNLPQRKKEVFVDYAFNMSEENFAKYRKFIPALINDDKKGVEEEYIRNMRDENDNLIPLGRNKIFKKFFPEFFPERERSRASYSFSHFPKETKL